MGGCGSQKQQAAAGASQVKAMKDVAGRLKIDLAQFRAMEAFAMFASDLDAASRQQLSRGARLVELLKQPQSSPMPVQEQVVVVWAGTNGKLDDVAVEDVRRFEREFLDFLRAENAGILNGIRDTGKLDGDALAGLDKAVETFKKQFSSGTPHAGVHAGSEQFSEIDADHIDQAQIVKGKA